MSQNPVIVGAGPVGLAAALFLAKRGITSRIIEKRLERSHESRALAVNPRTLDLLQHTGVSERMIELGRKLQGVSFYRHSERIGTVSLNGLHPRYPFLLALSQSTTERLLEDALTAAGGRVERGVEMTLCQPNSHGVDIELSIKDRAEQTSCPWLLAADGAHSTARKCLDIGFPGSAFDNDWHLADLPLETSLDAQHGHGFFLAEGGLSLLLPVVNGDEKPGSPQIWRVFSNHPDPLQHLVNARPAGEPVWSSKFRISHRLVDRFSQGGVYLAGDAAHIHSPIGARGMNLGIEDAWVFAELAAKGGLDRYHELRRPVDAAVVRRIERLTRFVSSESAAVRFVRQWVMPVALGIPAVTHRMRRIATGLDHPIPTP